MSWSLLAIGPTDARVGYPSSVTLWTLAAGRAPAIEARRPSSAHPTDGWQVEPRGERFGTRLVQTHHRTEARSGRREPIAGPIATRIVGLDEQRDGAVGVDHQTR